MKWMKMKMTALTDDQGTPQDMKVGGTEKVSFLKSLYENC